MNEQQKAWRKFDKKDLAGLTERHADKACNFHGDSRVFSDIVLRRAALDAFDAGWAAAERALKQSSK